MNEDRTASSSASGEGAVSKRDASFWRMEALAIIVTLAAALMVRWFYGVAYLNDVPLALTPINDARAYWEMGLALYREGWLLHDRGPFYQAPLYPYLLALIHHGGEHRVQAFAHLQLFLGAINVVLVYALGRVYLPRKQSILAALLYSLCHLPLIQETKLLAETPGAALYLLFACLFGYWLRIRLLWLLILSGLFFALAVIARPHMLFTLPFVSLLIAWLCGHDTAMRPLRRWAPLGAFVLTVTLGVAPVPLYNALIGGDAVPLTANSGVTLYMGTNPLAQGGLAPVPGLSNNIEDQRTQSVELASNQAGRPLTPSQASNWWVRHTLRWALENPGAFVTLQAKKLLWALYHTPPAVNYSFHFEREFIPWLGWLRLFTILTLTLGLAAIFWRPLDGGRKSPEVADALSLANSGRWTVDGERIQTIDSDASLQQKSINASEEVGGQRRGLGSDPAWLFLLCLFAGYLTLSLVYYASDRFLAAQMPFLAIMAMMFVSDRRWTEDCRRKWLRLGACVAVAALLAGNPWLGWNAPAEKATGWYNLGLLYEDRGNLFEAERAYLVALEATPDHPAALLNLGSLLARRGDLHTSTRLFEHVLQLQPDNEIARRNLEINRQRMGEADRD